MANVLQMQSVVREDFPADCPFPTCQRTALDNIQQAKREWESTADSLPHLIFLLNAEGRITRANRAVEHWKLGRVQDINGRELHDLLHPGCSDTDCYFEAFWLNAWHALDRESHARCEADDAILGRHLQIDMRSNPGIGADAGFVVLTVHDVTALKQAHQALQKFNEELEQRIDQRTMELTRANEHLRREMEERKRVEQALSNSRAQYHMLLESMNEGFVIQGPHGILSYVNERLCEMLGYPREEMIGRPTKDFVASSSLLLLQEQMQRRKRGEYAPYEIMLVRKDGEKLFARISPRPLFETDGSFGGSFSVVTDLSAQLRAEVELRESESELRLLSAQLLKTQEQERKRIARELHDGIGQSLSAVKFCVENTLRLLTGDTAAHGIKTLESTIPKVQGAIEEVRRISMALRPSTLDDLGILATIGWFCREYQTVYEDIRIEKHIDIREQDVPAPLKTIIYRILQEAMNNIAKHGGADCVQLALHKTGNAIELAIEDNGVGFDTEEVLSRERAHRGAGLASMRERAESSGGSFAIQSHVGEGTRIHVAWRCCNPKTGVCNMQ